MTLTEIRSALAGLGEHPKKALGQNFLHDQNLAAWIAAQAGIGPDDCVVEIGPGLGSLTAFLTGRCRRLVLLEKDRALAGWLAGRFGGPGVEIVTGDALDFDLRGLWGGGPVKVLGNLPYYVSTPLIEKFASAFSPASMLVFTLQREVADRLAAGVGDEGYGAMSVCVQRRWRVKFLRRLPPSVFFPEPRVESAVVELARRPAAEVRPLDDDLFEQVVRKGFSERRKQLRKLLAGTPAAAPEIFSALGVPESVRGEALTLHQWEEIAARIAPSAAQKGCELFDEVDAEDRPIGPKPRDVIHVNNLRHRAVHIFLFNRRGELFLQKRSSWKDKNPGLWDSSAAGHVDAGESYAAAAARETREELGADPGPLEPLGKLDSSPETSWEFVEYFCGTHEGPFQLARLEVDTGAFFDPAMIDAWLAARPQDFSPLFRLIYPRVRNFPT